MKNKQREGKKRGRIKSAADTADLLSTFLKDRCCSREQFHPCSICGLAPVFLTSKTYRTMHRWSCSNSLHPASTHTYISIRCTKLALQGKENIQGRKKKNSPDKRNKSIEWVARSVHRRCRRRRRRRRRRHRS